MKNKLLTKFISIFALALCVSQKAFALSVKPFVTFSQMYANVNDPQFNFVSEFELIKDPFSGIKKPILGASIFLDKGWNFSVSTNRLFNSKAERAVTRKSDDAAFRNVSELNIDSIGAGYLFDRFNASLVFSNVELDKTLFYQEKRVGYEKVNAITESVNVGYFLTKHVLPSVSYVFPNKKLDLESAFAFNVTYLF